jgi:hypothetical protein
MAERPSNTAARSKVTLWRFQIAPTAAADLPTFEGMAKLNASQPS